MYVIAHDVYKTISSFRSMKINICLVKFMKSVFFTEQQLAMSSSNKYKELKQEMQREKVRFTSLEKQYQDKVVGKDQEFQALQLRMQTAINENMADRSAMQARIQQLEMQLGDQSRYKQLIEVKT